MIVEQLGAQKEYTFLCNTCYSTLRAKGNELNDSGIPKIRKYNCPVCKAFRYVEDIRLEEVEEEEKDEESGQETETPYLFNRRNNIS